ncbi:GDNF family receptor alpha-like [Alligator mississippiensis]|uniref:GDNF family receptor alpha-like n=1 Tax=Alligator mississippiensis TaxID=8496 RepID=A0A151PDJ9_ALLMI|nr:GDNF family receptor alpha-like [Alligator mississippiensis]
MGALLLLVLAVSFSSSFTSQTTDCLQVREQCINAANGCESVWNIIEDVCNISGNSCKAKGSVVCNEAIQFLADQYPKCKSCLCTKNDSCSIKMLLEQQCGLKKEHLDPSANSDIQLNFMLHTKHKDIKHTGERENDCNIAKQSCRNDHYCFVEYKNFQRDAKENIAFDEEDYDDERDQDTDADNINMEIKLQWNLSALSKQEHTENGTCLDVNRECIEDEVCNRQLSLYLKVCSVNKKCNMKDCQAAIRFFYQNMPFNVAQMLTFCACTQLDKSCQKAKELLHGKPCAVNIVPPPSCLSIIRQCQNNELCRKKYEMFWSMCWRHVTRRCYEDKACLETLIKDDMTCSGSADCRAAYIDNWGTMLRVECSCNTVPLAEQPLCKLFQHMLHGKSCFKQISSEKPHFHWMHTDRPGEKLPRTRLQSSFKGETIHIIAYTSCIILILGIVMLALLKTRACRTTYQSRHTSPDHSSETFGIH